MIRVAAVGDVHFGTDTPGLLRPHLEAAAGDMDLLLLAGDLTRRGQPAEARLLAEELRGLSVPVVAVLGNHDYHHGAEREVAAVLEAAGPGAGGSGLRRAHRAAALLAGRGDAGR